MNAVEKAQVWAKDLEIVDALVADGFVHVTGLSSKAYNQEPYIISSNLNQYEFSINGAMGSNNGMTAAITPHGFYFLKSGSDNLDKSITEKLSFNNGNGVGVCCSNGDKLYSDAILVRLADPLDEHYGDPFEGISTKA